MPVIIVIALFGIALGFNISVLDPFIFNEKVRVLAPPGFKNSALGTITILALLVALFVQPIIGQWSDRTPGSRWKKRAPYLAAGAVGLCFALATVLMANSMLVLILGAILVSAFSNTTQAAWQALIPDFVPKFQHGTAAGTKTIMELIGIVCGVGAAGYFLLHGNLWGAPLVTVLLFFGIFIITVAVLPKVPVVSGKAAPSLPKNPLWAMMSGIRDAPPAFRWWVLNRFLFWSSVISIRTFMLNFLEEVMGYPPAEAQALGSRIFVVLGVGVFVLALPAGAVADRTGRRPIIFMAGLMAAAGTLLIIFGQQLFILYVAGGLIAVGAGIFAGPSWALATDLAPPDKGALYLALANGATVLGSMGGRFGGGVIDGVNQMFGTVALGYMVNFGIAALFLVGSSLVALKIPETSRQ